MNDEESNSVCTQLYVKIVIIETKDLVDIEERPKMKCRWKCSVEMF